MKVLILASILCFVGADLMKRAAPVVDDSIVAFLHGSTSTGSLSEALGVNEKWLDEAGDDIQTELSKHLKEALNKLLQKIKEQVDDGMHVGQELLEKAKEFHEMLEEKGEKVGNKSRELLQKIKEKAKETLQKLLEKLGLGKRNFDDQLDSVARSSFGDIIEEIIKRVTSDENIQKIRDYIKKIGSNSKFVQTLKKLMEQIPDGELKDFIRSLLDNRPTSHSAIARGETWDKIKNFFKDLKVKIGEHSKKFGEWVKGTWGKGMDKLREKYGVIKAIAMEFIAHGKDVSAEVAREALEFFRPYKEDLGKLWEQLVEVAKQAIGQF